MSSNNVGVSTSSNGQGPKKKKNKKGGKNNGKKGGNVSKNKVISQTRVNQTSRAVQLSPEAKAWFDNLMHPSHPFMMPRLVPSEAAPHHFKTTLHIESGSADFPETKAGAFIITPGILDPLVVMRQDEHSTEWNNTKSTPMHHISSSWQGIHIDYDDPLVDADRNTLTATKLNLGAHYSEEVGAVLSGGRCYAVKNASVPAGWGMSIHNRGGNAETLNVWICDVNLDTGVKSNIQIGSGVSISPGATANVSVTSAWAQGPTSDAIAFGIIVGTGGASLDVRLRSPGITAGASWIWDPQPFFQASQNTVIGDFMEAEKYSLTAFSALISNTSAEMLKGGTIRAAQLPGGTRSQLPLDPSKLYTFLGNINSIHTLRGMQLKDGAFWSYHPEKIQDVMFRKHLTPEDMFLYGDKELPYFVVAFKWAADSAAPELDVELNICMEYLTNSLVSPKFTSPTDTTRLIELWLMLGNQSNHVSHNPNHFDAIKNMSKIVLDRTLNNPEFRSAAIRAGKTLGKIALAAAV